MISFRYGLPILICGFKRFPDTPKRANFGGAQDAKAPFHKQILLHRASKRQVILGESYTITFKLGWNIANVVVNVSWQFILFLFAFVYVMFGGEIFF